MPQTIILSLSRRQVEDALEAVGVDLESLRTDYVHAEDAKSSALGQRQPALAFTANSFADVALFLVELTASLMETVIDEDELDPCELIEPVRQLARRVRTRTLLSHGLTAYWPGVVLSDQG